MTFLALFKTKREGSIYIGRGYKENIECLDKHSNGNKETLRPELFIFCLNLRYEINLYQVEMYLAVCLQNVLVQTDHEHLHTTCTCLTI